MYFTVRVYLQDLAYGGPEEGGWWFEYGEFAPEFGHLTRVYQREEAAYAHCRKLNAGVLAKANEDRLPISSVLSKGRFSANVFEGEAPLRWPEVCPHYE